MLKKIDQTNNTSTSHSLFGKSTGNSPPNQKDEWWLIHNVNQSRLLMRLNNEANQSNLIYRTLPYFNNVVDGRWKHLVVTINARPATPTANDVSFYLDGKPLAVEVATTGTIGFNYSFTNDLNFYVGNRGEPISPAYWNGEIEEFAIWNTKLSQRDVERLYRRGATRLDLNVYSCTDASCNTKTDSLLIQSAPNNTEIDISSLSNSQYLGYEVFYKPISEFANYNAGKFWVGSFLNNVRIEFETTSGDTCVWTLNNDWEISTNIVCENEEIDLGTGKLIIENGGLLELIDSNLLTFGLELEGTGDLISMIRSWIGTTG